MLYRVSCECGQQLTVTAADAGTTRTCACGRAVAVPSLRELRQASGEAVTRTPELLIAAMVRNGERPPADCARCRGPADRGVVVLADCEQPESRRPGWGTFLLQVFLLGLIYAWLRQQEDAPVVGERVAIELHLRVCSDCRGLLRVKGLREAVCAVPAYQLLLEKYPAATLSVVRDWPGE